MSKSITTKKEATGKASPLKPVKASKNDDLDKQVRQDAQDYHESRHGMLEEMILEREVALRYYLDGITHLAASELDEYGRCKKRGLYRQFAAEKPNTAEYPVLAAEKIRLYDEFRWSLIQLEEFFGPVEKVIEGKSPTYRFNRFHS